MDSLEAGGGEDTALAVSKIQDGKKQKGIWEKVGSPGSERKREGHNRMSKKSLLVSFNSGLSWNQKERTRRGESGEVPEKGRSRKTAD